MKRYWQFWRESRRNSTRHDRLAIIGYSLIHQVLLLRRYILCLTTKIKDVLKMMPYGFYSFTTKNGDDVNAMVVNWVSQMSYEPRLLAVGIQKSCYSHGLVEAGPGLRIESVPAKRSRRHHGCHQRTRQETRQDERRRVPRRATNRRSRPGGRRSLYRVPGEANRGCRWRPQHRGRRKRSTPM